MGEIEHREVQVGGLRMHVAEQGSGPLVVLLHGFPETCYSWRHQLAALAGAGFRAVAPDQRGYGRSDRPEDPERYTLLDLVGDVIGLINALGGGRPIGVGHDWGAPGAVPAPPPARRPRGGGGGGGGGRGVASPAGPPGLADGRVARGVRRPLLP